MPPLVQHAKITREREESTLKMFPPELCHDPAFFGVPWGVINGSYSRNQATLLGVILHKGTKRTIGFIANPFIAIFADDFRVTKFYLQLSGIFGSVCRQKPEYFRLKNHMLNKIKVSPMW